MCLAKDKSTTSTHPWGSFLRNLGAALRLSNGSEHSCGLTMDLFSRKRRLVGYPEAFSNLSDERVLANA